MSEEGAAVAAAAAAAADDANVVEGSNAKPKVISVDVKECPVEIVTVFSDCAELVRNVKVTVDAPGLYDVRIENITEYTMPDSLHVSGGLGAATVLEVLSKIERKSRDECKPSNDKEKEESKARLQELKQQLRTLEIQDNVTMRTLSWLQTWADKVRSTPVNQAKSDPSFLTAPYIENVRNFGKFFAEETLKHSSRRAQLSKSIAEVRSEISALEKALKLKEQDRGVMENFTLGIVSLLVKKAGTIQFQIKYSVRCARWSSAYDARVSSEGKMDISYYGEIVNSTKEDWEHTRVFLSTASPSVGGHPGELGLATVSISQPPPAPLRFKAKRIGKFMAKNECECVKAAAAPAMGVLTATASKSLASCTFAINRKATIPSDHEKHRVTVTILSGLQTKLNYVCTPSESDRVFLKASTVNKTEFPLLEGPCSTFIDGSFVACSTLKYTAIGEPFKFFLGTDPELRLKYVQPFRVDDKAGIIMKSSVQKFSGSIELRNGKPLAVNVTVLHPLPKADNAEIKVALTEPKIAKEDKAVKINAKNLIRWKSKIEPGATFKMPIVYTISYPQGRDVYFHK